MITMFAIASVALFAACKDDDSLSPDENGNDINVNFSPGNNDTNIALNKVVSAIFSEEMDVTTINATSFTLKQGSNDVAGNVSYSGFTAIFTPAAPLNQNMVYTANISTEAKSALGNAIEDNVSWSFTTGANATGMAAINLGTSAQFVILAKTAITNVPASAITGDIAVSPAATTFITGFSLIDNTGFATSAQITGKAYAADMADPTPINLTNAVNDMTTAYNEAAGRTLPDYVELGAGNIGGQSLVPGLYKWTNTVTAPTEVVITGGANDVWIFQIAGDLTVSSGVNITLSGGAKAENIFWQVAGEVTVGTTAKFKGIVLSMTGITLNTGATLSGRALAQTAVILDGNIVTQP